MLGDVDLMRSYEKMNQNSKYTSWRIQNECISIISNDIKQSIIAKVKNAEFYSIIFDETSDLSDQEQIAFVIRIVENGESSEYFIGFKDCYSELEEDQYSLTGEI